MSNKLNIDNTMKKVEGISKTVDIILRNRLIIAILFIVDGITFILNSHRSLSEMARNIVVLVLIAVVSILITNLCSKNKDVKTIIISLVILVLGIIFYIYSDLIAAYIQLIMALFIISYGVTNLVTALHLNKFSKYTNAINKRINSVVNSKKADIKVNIKEDEQMEKFYDVNNKFNEGLEQQKKKLLSPLKNIINKSNKFSNLYIVINIASIIFGIILLIFPDVSMVLWGIIFLYTGISDLLASMSAMNISEKIKNRKFKEILYGDEKRKQI